MKVVRALAVCVCSGLALVPTITLAQSLEQLIDSALSQDAEIKSYVFLEQSSAAKVKTAKWQFYPTPSFEVRSAVSGYEDDVSDQVVTFSLRQPIWNGGRIQAGVDLANVDLSIQKYATGAKQLDLAQQVVHAYGQWWIAHRKRLSWDQGLEIHQTLTHQVSRRVEVGVSAKSDLSLAQGRLSATQAERNLAFAQEQVALDNLILLTNIKSLDLKSKAQLPSLKFSLSAYPALLDTALVSNIEIKQAQARAEKALAEQTIQKSSVWPLLYLQAERRIGDFDSPGRPHENRVFIGFSSDLRAGLSFQSDAQASTTAYSAALSQVDSEKMRITRELRSSLTLLIASNDRQLSLNSARTSADQGYRSSSRQFKAGRKDWQELLNSARELAQADAQWVEAYGKYLVASWQMMLDTQGLSFLVGSEP